MVGDILSDLFQPPLAETVFLVLPDRERAGKTSGQSEDRMEIIVEKVEIKGGYSYVE